MKKVLSILFASLLVWSISCTKETVMVNNPEKDIEESPADNGTEKKTITFSASIDFNKETKASLSGLNINWQSGDYVGIATDNSATIVAYPVTPDGVDETKCTITVDAVEGATAYYAIFKGRLGDGGAGKYNREADDFSDVTFNTSTKTFSGLTVGNQQVAVGSLASYLWYTDGFPLAMAGKSDGTTLVMRPCLALVKLQINSESVPADYFYKTITYTSSSDINHDYNYSAVRGFNLYQKGSSTIYSSGDYTVQIEADGTLTTTSTGTQKEYRQISQTDKLVADTDYIMCLIPGGEITSFKIDFLGYSANTPTLTWDAVYSMSKSGSITVSPGDCYDLGKLNPLGRKKAKNEAGWDAADAEAASFTPAITIDGDVTEWNTITGTSNGSHTSFKATSDEKYLYFYSYRSSSTSRYGEIWGHHQGYIYIALDLDNNMSTGSGSISGNGPYEFIGYIHPYGGSSAEPAIATSDIPQTASPSPYTLSNVSCSGAVDGDGVAIEFSIPRADLPTIPGTPITVYSWGNKDLSKATLSCTL